MAVKHSKHQNQVRICGGMLRGRKISFGDAQGLRPTPEMVREKLFNWLGQDLTGQRVLDLFSGSGVMGFEAASRNAKQVVMCEQSPQTAASIQAHVKHFNLMDKVQVVQQDALWFLQHQVATYDLVLLDPPFAWQEWASLFTLLQTRLASHAYVYIEAGRLPEMPDWLRLHRQGKAGQSQYALCTYVQVTE